MAFYAPTKGEGHLILGDGSALNARINIDEGQTLNIYSQKNGTGKLEAKSNSYMSENPGSSEGSVMAAIGSRTLKGNDGYDGLFYNLWQPTRSLRQTLIYEKNGLTC